MEFSSPSLGKQVEELIDFLLFALLEGNYRGVALDVLYSSTTHVESRNKA